MRRKIRRGSTQPNGATRPAMKISEMKNRSAAGQLNRSAGTASYTRPVAPPPTTKTESELLPNLSAEEAQAMKQLRF
eukprot:SAG11_NODE_13838_length_637_cov_0.949814_1_plen_76_part_10